MLVRHPARVRAPSGHLRLVRPPVSHQYRTWYMCIECADSGCNPGLSFARSRLPLRSRSSSHSPSKSSTGSASGSTQSGCGRVLLSTNNPADPDLGHSTAGTRTCFPQPRCRPSSHSSSPRRRSFSHPERARPRSSSMPARAPSSTASSTAASAWTPRSWSRTPPLLLRSDAP